MQEIKNKVLELVNSYKEQLTAKGIKITVSKRYMETAVGERSGGTGSSAIFNAIDRKNDRKKENENGYNYKRNNYHSIVLTISPLESKIVKNVDCKEYAFLIKKTERAHIGLEPQQKTYAESKILGKIEKRILKILKKAELKSVEEICKNTIFDACRYSHSPKYEYKTTFCGKDRFTWDMIFMFFAVTVLAVVIASVWAVTKLR